MLEYLIIWLRIFYCTFQKEVGGAQVDVQVWRLLVEGHIRMYLSLLYVILWPEGCTFYF
jgi:hypothetical protein